MEIGFLSIVATGTLLASGCLFLLAAYLKRHVGKPGAGWLLLTLALHGTWCLLYGSAMIINDPVIHEYIMQVSWLALLWVGYTFLLSVMDYTGRLTTQTRPIIALLSIAPAFGTVGVFGPTQWILWQQATVQTVNGFSMMLYEFSVGTYLIMAFMFAYTGIAVLMLIETVLSYGELFHQEALAIAASTFPPAVAAVLWLSGTGAYPAVSLVGLFSLPYAGLNAYAFIHADLFESYPTTRRAADRNAIDELPNAVAVTDTSENIVRANTNFHEQFVPSGGRCIGEKLTEFVSIEESDSDRGVRKLVNSTAEGRPRRYRVIESSLEQSDGSVVGNTLVFQDVTEQEGRAQRLEVFNRILRHNIRNKMSVVSGFAGEISEETDDVTIQEWAQKIIDGSREVSEISSKARTFGQMREGGLHMVPIDLRSVIEAVVENLDSETVTVEFTVNGGDDLSMVTDRDMLRLAIENVVENAVEHNTAENAFVEIEAEYAEVGANGGVVIRVVDNGPGIAESDLKAVMEGTETAVVHGSSIGLWIIKWSVEAIGGDVEFRNTDQGAEVTLHVPNTG